MGRKSSSKRNRGIGNKPVGELFGVPVMRDGKVLAFVTIGFHAEPDSPGDRIEMDGEAWGPIAHAGDVSAVNVSATAMVIRPSARAPLCFVTQFRYHHADTPSAFHSADRKNRYSGIVTEEQARASMNALLDILSDDAIELSAIDHEMTPDQFFKWQLRQPFCHVEENAVRRGLKTPVC